MIQDDASRAEVAEAEVAALRLELAAERGKRCGTCRHWSMADFGDKRGCGKLTDQSTLFEDYGGDGLLLATAPTFGCVEWEAK